VNVVLFRNGVFPQTLKLVQERVGNTLELIGIVKDFLNGTPAAQQLKIA
jgi:hypothetical protein